LGYIISRIDLCSNEQFLAIFTPNLAIFVRNRLVTLAKIVQQAANCQQTESTLFER
jgi:hypothetical protein